MKKNFYDSIFWIRKSLIAYQIENRLKTYLALNENPYPFPQELAREIFENIDLSKVGIYYDSPDEELLSLLVKYLRENSKELNEENVSVGNGADEIIYYLLLMFKDHRVFIFPPTYSCYELFARVLNVKIIKVPLRNEKLPLDDLKNSLNENSVVFLPNPNNPTGHLFEDYEIESLLNSGALIVLDEAYYEFAMKSYVDWIRKYKNLIVIRTFSKAFSLAGQRIGYVVSNPEIIDAYNRVRLPFNVDYVSQLFAKVSLKNLDVFKKRIKKIIAEREKMKRNLKASGYNVSDSKGNFVFIYLNQSEKENLLEILEENEVAVRIFPEGLRVTIGTPEQNEFVMKLLRGEKV